MYTQLLITCSCGAGSPPYFFFIHFIFFFFELVCCTSVTLLIQKSLLQLELINVHELPQGIARVRALNVTVGGAKATVPQLVNAKKK